MPFKPSTPLQFSFDTISMQVTLPDEISTTDLTAYAMFWYKSCVDMNDKKSMETTIKDCAEYLLAHPPKRLRAAAGAGSAKDLIDLGIRYASASPQLYTGCGEVRNPLQAVEAWARVRPDKIPHLPPTLLARVWGCLANQQWEGRFCSPAVLNIDCAYRACTFCEMAIELGMTPRVTFEIADGTERAGLRRWKDMPFAIPKNSTHDVTPDKFAALKKFWEVADRDDREYEASKARRAEKREKKPSAYVCAAEGCGIEATSKKGLMRCAGPCKGEYKPAYCGKECQKRDWKRHKRVCKQNNVSADPQTEGTPAAPSHPIDVGSASSTGDGNLLDREFTDEELKRTDGKELVVTMSDPRDPSKTIKLSSKTLSPLVLRDLRERANLKAHGTQQTAN